LTLEGVTAHEYPTGKFPLQESATGLELLVAGITLMGSVPGCPAVMLKGAGETLSVKSGILTLTITAAELSA